MNPTVSIILPTYNRAALIAKAVHSVLAQTFPDFELIIVDDASTDNSEDVIKHIADSRIRYIVHEENRGGAAARNTGIKTAAGTFIGFQDSDDQWLPDKLAMQVRAFRSSGTGTGAVYTGCRRQEGPDMTYIPSQEIRQKSGDLRVQLLRGNFITLPSLLIKKECLETVGIFDERLLRLHDWDLLIRISMHYDFVFIDEPLVVSSFTPESISSREDSLLQASEIILEKHRDEFRRYKKISASHHYFIADRSLKAGRWRKGIAFLWKAFKDNPRPGFLVSMVASLFGKNIYARYSSLARRFTSRNADSDSLGVHS